MEEDKLLYESKPMPFFKLKHTDTRWKSERVKANLKKES